METGTESSIHRIISPLQNGAMTGLFNWTNLRIWTIIMCIEQTNFYVTGNTNHHRLIHIKIPTRELQIQRQQAIVHTIVNRMVLFIRQDTYFYSFLPHPMECSKPNWITVQQINHHESHSWGCLLSLVIQIQIEQYAIFCFCKETWYWEII